MKKTERLVFLQKRKEVTKMKKILLLICVSAMSFAQFSVPKYETVTLDNGLTIYLMQHTEVPLINVSMVMKTGAIADGERHGLAFLTAEALRFGTASFTKAEIDQNVDFLGATISTNASLEYTSISAKFAKKDQATIFPILAEMMLKPRFDSDEFSKFKERHLANLKIEKDQPSAVLDTYFNSFMYQDHAYANPLSGTIEAVEKLSLAEVKSFYSTNYVPSQTALAVVGDFNMANMKKSLKKQFGSWKNKTVKPVALGVVPTYTKSRVLLIDKDNSLETRFMIGQKGIEMGHPDFVAISVVNTILGGRFTSWLNDELRVNAGLTYGARSQFDQEKVAGTFAISTFTKTQSTIECIDLALEVYGRLAKQGIDDETLLSAKNYVKGLFPPRYETAGSLARFLTSMYVYGHTVDYINSFNKNVEAVNSEKVKEIIATYFPQENLQLVMIGKASEIQEKVKKYGELTVKKITE
jgi:predicted Zn-dependent peptidase